MLEIKIHDTQVQKFLKASPKRARWANSEALKMTGGHWRKEIRRFIETGGRGWQALSAGTKKMRSGKKSPLFYLAKLVRFKYGTSKGVQYVRIGFFPTRILTKRQRQKTGRRYSLKGTSRQKARFRKQMSMTAQAMARLHEFGKRRPVTKRMRRFMAARGVPIKKSTRSMDLPARPMIGPVFKRDRREMRNYYAKRFFQKFFSKQKPRLGF